MSKKYCIRKKLNLMSSNEDSVGIYNQLFDKDKNFCEDRISKIEVKISYAESETEYIETHTELNLKYPKDSFDLYSLTDGTCLGKFEYEFNKNNGVFILRRLSSDTGKLYIYLDFIVETEDEDDSEHKKLEAQNDTNFTRNYHVKQFTLNREELRKEIKFDSKVKISKIEISNIVYKGAAGETLPFMEFETEDQRYSSTHMYKLYFDCYTPASYAINSRNNTTYYDYEINGHIYINSKSPQSKFEKENYITEALILDIFGCRNVESFVFNIIYEPVSEDTQPPVTNLLPVVVDTEVLELGKTIDVLGLIKRSPNYDSSKEYIFEFAIKSYIKNGRLHKPNIFVKHEESSDKSWISSIDLNDYEQISLHYLKFKNDSGVEGIKDYYCHEILILTDHPEIEGVSLSIIATAINKTTNENNKILVPMVKHCKGKFKLPMVDVDLFEWIKSRYNIPNDIKKTDIDFKEDMIFIDKLGIGMGYIKTTRRIFHTPINKFNTADDFGSSTNLFKYKLENGKLSIKFVDSYVGFCSTEDIDSITLSIDAIVTHDSVIKEENNMNNVGMVDKKEMVNGGNGYLYQFGLDILGGNLAAGLIQADGINYKRYDKKKGKVINVNRFVIECNKLCKVIPTLIDDVAVGDILVYDANIVFVKSIDKSKNITGVGLKDNCEIKIVPESYLNTDMCVVSKVVNLMNPGKINPMMLMLSFKNEEGVKGAMDKKTMLMVMAMQNQNKDGANNNMLPLLLMDDMKDDKALMLMMMMSQQNNGGNMNNMLPLLLMDGKSGDDMLKTMMAMNMMNQMNGGKKEDA